MVEVIAFVIFVTGIFYVIGWTIKCDPEADARKAKKNTFMKNPEIQNKWRKPDA